MKTSACHEICVTVVRDSSYSRCAGCTVGLKMINVVKKDEAGKGGEREFRGRSD